MRKPVYASLVLPRPSIPAEQLLEDWMWLLEKPHDLLVVTKMGDAFLRAPTGSVVFLDTLEGNLKAVAPDEASFRESWTSGHLDPALFSADMIAELEAGGVLPGPDECYSFKLPPIIGGALEPSNIEVLDLLLHLSVAGQIHRQSKDLPPGTPISGFKTVED